MSANMFSQRALQLSMRRLGATNPSSLGKTSVLTRLSYPAAIATGNYIQHRSAATTVVGNDKGFEILAAQRRNRPISPHLSIYQPQITWYLSILHRITGSVVSGGFYVFGAAYLVAPLFGWHLETASIAAAFASWPIWAKLLTKATVSFPFVFHSLNGIRHLVWDTGAMFTNKQVIVTGWTIIGLTAAGTLALIFN